ncbi:hypothetical protein HRE53_03940 [Acaryochloris sp. 'Moss Beach']|nr:hypothetical protein I1H34_17735 [Acaryochloris marina S15]UJB71859.1 hypothetical protein HRE53_03940 [Acaryochloris sp. 'Moss Beach']
MKVSALTKDLKAAQTKETSLQKKVAQLESQLAEQKTALTALQKSTHQTDAIKEKLEQTTQDAVRLAKENDRLQKQVAELQTSSTSRKTQKSSALATTRKKPTNTKSIFHRPVRSNQAPPSRSFDTWCYD